MTTGNSTRPRRNRGGPDRPASSPLTPPASSIESRFQMIGQGPQDLDPGEILIVRLHQGPGRNFGAGAVHHVAHRMLVVGGPLPVAPVLGGDLEALVGLGLPLMEAGELLVGADGQPELHHQPPSPHHLVLEIVDLGIGPHPVGLRAKALDPLHQHPTVPGSVEDQHLAVAGQMAPETPQIGLSPLLLGGGGHRHDVVLAGVQGRRDPADGASLAGGIHALEDRDEGTRCETRMPGEQRQAALLAGQFPLVSLLLHGLAQRQCVDQVATIVGRRRQRRPAPARLPGLAGQLETPGEGGQQRPPHGQGPIALVGAIHDQPRRLAGAGEAQGMARQRVRASDSRAFRRCRRAFLVRWNHSLTSRTPSRASMASKRLISSRRWSRLAFLPSFRTRAAMGSVYQLPKTMAIRPLGGRTRQKRHRGGRSRSSGLGGPKAWVWMWRGSIHSLRRLTVSPLPAAFIPLIRITTAKWPSSMSSYWASSRLARKAGRAWLYSSLATA